MRYLRIVVSAALVLGALVSPALAETGKCRLGVLKASAAYARVTLAARQRCEESLVKGKVAACPNAGATAAVTKAAAKLAQAVGKACGGANKTCNVADGGADADDAPAAIGFPAECPDYAGRACGQPIAGCGDVVTCLRCVADHAVDDTADLAWGGFLAPSPEKAVVKCQRAIGRSSGALFAATSKALQRCWESVAKGKILGPCPVPGDAKAAAAIAKATAKQSDLLCKACGGGGDRAPADGRCDAQGALELSRIGATNECPPAIGACARLITDLDDFAECERCATSFAATCVDRFGVQGFAPFPPSCTGAPLAFVAAVVDGVGGVDGLASPFSVAVSPDGKHVYVGGQSDDAIAVFTRNAATGALAFVEQENDGVGGVTGLGNVVAITVSADGQHVYTASIDGSVAAFRRNTASGALTFVEAELDGIGGVDGLGFARDVEVAPDGAHVYVAGLGDDAVVIFTRNPTTGALAFVGIVKDGVGGVDGIDGAAALAFAPGGTTLYVAGSVDRAIAVFARDPATGLLGFVEREKDGEGGVESLFGVSGVAVSGDGTHVYAAAAVAASLTIFARDAATGTLALQGKLQDGLGGVEGLHGAGDVVVGPSGKAVFTSAQQDSAVAAFGRDDATGALTFRTAITNGDGVTGLDSASGLAISPDGLHLYVAGSDDDAVAVFAVE